MIITALKCDSALAYTEFNLLSSQDGSAVDSAKSYFSSVLVVALYLYTVVHVHMSEHHKVPRLRYNTSDPQKILL